MSPERARACLDALARLPASASWNERAESASASAALAGASVPPDLELRLAGCPLLTRAQALTALAGEHLLLIGDSLPRLMLPIFSALK